MKAGMITDKEWDNFLYIYEKNGACQKLAAKTCGIGARTVRLKLKSDSDFQDRYILAKQRSVELVERTFYEQFLTGAHIKLIAIIFYLKAKAGWEDKPKSDPSEMTVNYQSFKPENKEK